MKLDLELAKKYSRPGPRYTSYPTAPHFSEDIGPAHYATELNDAGTPVTDEFSLYFHLPFCRSLCYFCACNMIITSRREHISDYLNILKQEIDLLSRQINKDRKVSQLHWGGGTPTYLTADEIRGLMSHIHSRFSFTADAEISIEIHPGEMSPDRVVAIAESGFNRVSCGVQDFNPEVQAAINRIQPYEITAEVLELLKSNGIDHFNLDLIYGLPYQTVESFSETLEQVLTLHPSRLAVYNYAYVPWLKKHQNLIDEALLPTLEVKLAMHARIIEYLTSVGGMTFIGMDHFARPEDELALALNKRALHRNFQGYSTKAGLDMYSLGTTSISQTYNYYVQNTKLISNYRNMVAGGQLPVERGIRLTEDDHLRRQIIQDIMCQFELDTNKLSANFGIDFRADFEHEIARLETFVDDGLLVDEGDKILITENGRLFIRNIAMAFDAYLPQDSQPTTSKQPRYSKTV